MRIAGGIIALFLALIIFVQSLAAGTADAIAEKGGSGGSFGFFVGIGFVIGGALLIGRVMKGALGVFLGAALIAWIGAASSIFGDLWVWGFVAFVYAATCGWGLRKGKKARNVEDGVPVTTPAA
jgi:hypothetical protein